MVEGGEIFICFNPFLAGLWDVILIEMNMQTTITCAAW
jgi:hypothetical protein